MGINQAQDTTTASYNHHRNSIRIFFDMGRPITVIIPAFPFKSQNNNKTIGVLPDYGEVLALRRLNDLCRNISEYYPPGSIMTICSDGRVFSDLLGIPESIVSAYHYGINKIISENNLDHLRTYSLDDAGQPCTDVCDLRSWLIGRYGEFCEALPNEVRSTDRPGPESQFLFNGIKRFLVEDQAVLHPEWSKTNLKKRCSQLSHSVIQRSRAWGNFLNEKFPDAIRLSIHPQPLYSNKIGIILLESNDQWRTPWHSAPMFDGSRFYLVRRIDAERNHAVLVIFGNNYLGYVLKQPPAIFDTP
jgi:pyoverdine/dityrosine biosynthesis protein Dit1